MGQHAFYCHVCHCSLCTIFYTILCRISCAALSQLRSSAFDRNVTMKSDSPSSGYATLPPSLNFRCTMTLLSDCSVVASHKKPLGVEKWCRLLAASFSLRVTFKGAFL